MIAYCIDCFRMCDKLFLLQNKARVFAEVNGSVVISPDFTSGLL